jgi:hypothetical protein
MAIYIDFVTQARDGPVSLAPGKDEERPDPSAAPGSKTAMLFFCSGFIMFYILTQVLRIMGCSDPAGRAVTIPFVGVESGPLSSE